MIEKAILTVLGILLLLVFSIQMLLFSLPLFQRLIFDAICHRAVMQMDHDGGLTINASQKLQSDLVQSGFAVDIVSGTSDVPFGSEASLYVKVSLPVYQLTSSMQMEEEVRSFTYVNSTISRKYTTYDGEP